MSRCSHPVYALDRGIKENGKRNIKILPRRADLYSYQQLSERYGKGSIIALPCGKCLACRINKSKDWAVRCCLEASCYDDNYFVTFTYSDDKLPGDLKLHREHLTDFIKRLRHYYPGVRYFGCGEYGSRTKRPHYHLILFNFPIKDLRCVSKGSLGGYYYESKQLEKIWSHGNILIGEVSYSSCAYVARYATKKLYGSPSNDEFICMSTKPGLGYTWLQDHFDIFDKDVICGPFGSSKVSKIPRYFEKVFENIDYFGCLSLLKDQRICKSEAKTLNTMIQHGFSEVEKMYQFEGTVLEKEFSDSKRRKDL